MTATSANPAQDQQAWGPIFAMSLAAFALVASEFMPVSLLTPIAADFHISEGQAGQAISISGAFALLTSLFIASLAGRLDRKILLLSLTLLMVASGTVVAFAPNYIIFMGGRALIGIAIGGFWSLSAATAMRLVADRHVPRALAILNSGSALASVLAAPLGSFPRRDHRLAMGVFLHRSCRSNCFLLETVRLACNEGGIPSGFRQCLQIAGTAGGCDGYCSVRAVLHGAVHIIYLSAPVSGEGDPGRCKCTVAYAARHGRGRLHRHYPGGRAPQQASLPDIDRHSVLMALIALAFVFVGSSSTATAILLALWGLIATAAPVGWWTWMARTLPDDAEAGGGLVVAMVQLAIMGGATIGGVLFDMHGYRATFGASAAMLAAAAMLTMLTARSFQKKKVQYSDQVPVGVQ